MYVFKKIKDKWETSATITVESENVSLTEIFQDFKAFLLACGFTIKPGEEIALVDEDCEAPITPEDEDEY
jgi:hypothetical protein